MHTTKRWIILVISVAIAFGLTASASLAFGAPIAGQPGGFLAIWKGFFVDDATGFEYGLTLVAREADDEAGRGKATFQLNGPGIQLCSAHGAGVDLGIYPGSEDFSGNNPLLDLQCGTAYGQAVSIDGCTAKVELHGYSHSDYPLVTYMGPLTVDLTFRKSPVQTNSGQISLKLFTIKNPINLSGNLIDQYPGPTEMDTCK